MIFNLECKEKRLIKKTSPDYPLHLTFISSIQQLLDFKQNNYMKRKRIVVSKIILNVSSELASKITLETNRWYMLVTLKMLVSAKSKLKIWIDTNLDEIYWFLSVCMLMSEIKS